MNYEPWTGNIILVLTDWESYLNYVIVKHVTWVPDISSLLLLFKIAGSTKPIE